MIGIGDYDGRMRKRKEVRTREDQVLFCGRKYRRDKKTGYYLCTTGSRGRLHVAVWEQKWGRKVPDGCVIHHLDWDKSNNNINNLCCLTVSEHEAVHNKIGGEAGKQLGYKIARERVDGVPGLCYNEDGGGLNERYL